MNSIRYRIKRITAIALAAAMMLGSGNGLSMLQTLSIVAAFPFAFIMVISMAALVKALRKENEE